MVSAAARSGCMTIATIVRRERHHRGETAGTTMRREKGSVLALLRSALTLEERVRPAGARGPLAAPPRPWRCEWRCGAGAPPSSRICRHRSVRQNPPGAAPRFLLRGAGAPLIPSTERAHWVPSLCLLTLYHRKPKVKKRRSRQRDQSLGGAGVVDSRLRKLYCYYSTVAIGYS